MSSSRARQNKKASTPAESQNVRRSIAIASARQRQFEVMRPTAMDFFSDMDDQGSTMAMDVDDVDPIEAFGEGISESKLAGADFFNSFQDDFDDTDIN
ncbi:small acidic protein 1-like [Pyrus communis]|uniref:small acidic protein 1-like n=1 Tax=Pyrus communis TaxID=23211 RepID=UPI0035C02AC6